MKLLPVCIVTVSAFVFLLASCVGISPNSSSSDVIDLTKITRTTHHSGSVVKALNLGRGINMGNGLEATPDENGWGNPIDLAFFPIMKSAGFENVRIPVRWSLANRTSLVPPYTIDPAFFARVDAVVDAALAAGLQVILNIHHYSETGHDIYQTPEKEAARFMAIWQQIATRYKDRPSSLVFELLNEANGQLTDSKLSSLFQQTVAAIRVIDPVHTIMLGGTGWNSIDGLHGLILPDDDNIIATFHYYDPMQFTHQGADWVSPIPTLGVLWPNHTPFPTNTVNPANDVLSSWMGSWYQRYNNQNDTTWAGSPSSMSTQFDRVKAWSINNDCPVYLGEFGAFSKADNDSRIRWTTKVREEAQRIGITWAYWEFSAGFGVYDRVKKELHSDLVQAITGK